MNTLESLSVKHPTDKHTVHSYLPIYEKLFGLLKNTEHPVLEIGVEHGGSLCIWKEWFSKATIHGADINPPPPYLQQEPEIVHFQANAFSPEALEHYRNIGKWAVIIEDGPHTLESQVWFCKNYPQLLAQDGVAVIEDVQDYSHCELLAQAVPEGFNFAAIDVRSVKGRHDDILFVMWRK